MYCGLGLCEEVLALIDVTKGHAITLSVPHPELPSNTKLV